MLNTKGYTEATGLEAWSWPQQIPHSRIVFFLGIVFLVNVTQQKFLNDLIFIPLIQVRGKNHTSERISIFSQNTCLLGEEEVHTTKKSLPIRRPKFKF